MAFEPAELGVVRADNAAVRGGTDAEVEVSVRSDRRAVGVVVADAGQLVHQDGRFTAGRDAEDAPALVDAAFCDVEVAVVENDAGPRAVVPAGCNDVVRPPSSTRSRRGVVKTSP